VSKQKIVTRPDHASLIVLQLRSAATQTPNAHVVVGVRMMMDGGQSG
jgi:hypothetical protein